RLWRRATPATLTGVRGRPTRACASSTDSETPRCSDQPTESNPAQAKVETAIAIFVKDIFVIMFLLTVRPVDDASQSDQCAFLGGALPEAKSASVGNQFTAQPKQSGGLDEKVHVRWRAGPLSECTASRARTWINRF